MKKIMFLIIIIILTSIVSAEEVIIVRLKYSYGDLSVISTYRGQNSYPLEDNSQKYKYNIFSYDDEVLYDNSFAIPLSYYYDNIKNPDQIYSLTLNETIFSLIVPYFPNAKSLTITGAAVDIKVDLSELSECNKNKVCEDEENNLNCPSDCFNSKKDGFCTNVEDGICKEDPDCSNRDPDCIIQEYRKNSKDAFNKGYISDSPKTEETHEDTNTYEKISLLLLIIIITTLSVYLIRKRIK